MFQARVTQFLRPDGRQKKFTVEMPDELHEPYVDMVNSGCRLEAEVISTGEVSVTVTSDEADVDIRVTRNDDSVVTALKEMLQAQKWRVASS